MKNSLPTGTTSLVERWKKDYHYALIKNNGETVITGSGKAGLKRAVEHAAKSPHEYSHIYIRNEFGKTFRVLELDGMARHNSPVYVH